MQKILSPKGIQVKVKPKTKKLNPLKITASKLIGISTRKYLLVSVMLQSSVDLSVAERSINFS